MLFDGNDRDLAAVSAVILEAHAPFDLGEQSVVLGEPDVESRFEPSSLLSNEDRAASDEHSVMTFDPEPL